MNAALPFIIFTSSAFSKYLKDKINLSDCVYTQRYYQHLNAQHQLHKVSFYLRPNINEVCTLR
jgi:hypothetical protein